MSSATQLPISEELRTFWNAESKSGKTRTIRIVIKNGKKIKEREIKQTFSIFLF